MIRRIPRGWRLVGVRLAPIAAALVLASGLPGADHAGAQVISLAPGQLENQIAFCAGVYLWQTGEASPQTQKALDMITELKKVDRRTAINLMYDARDERLINQLQGHDDAADPELAKEKLANCQAWTGIAAGTGEVRVLPIPWSRPSRTAAELDKDKVRNCAGMYTLQDPNSPSTQAAVALSAETSGTSLEEARLAAEKKAASWQDLRASGQAKPVEISNLVRRCSYWIDIAVPEGTPPFGEYPTRNCDDRCQAIKARMAEINAAALQGRTIECVEGERAAAQIMEPYYARGAEAIARYENSGVCIGGECYGGNDASLAIETRTAMCKALTRAIGAIPSQCVDEYKQVRAIREAAKCS